MVQGKETEVTVVVKEKESLKMEDQIILQKKSTRLCEKPPL
jgi:hypothetical protein